MVDAHLLDGGVIEVHLGLEGPAANRTADLLAFISGRPANNEMVGRWEMTSDITWVDARCAATCEVAPTSDAVFSLTRNGSPIATVTFEAGETIGVVDLLVEVTPAGTFRLRAPTTADPTLSDASITLSGDR